MKKILCLIFLLIGSEAIAQSSFLIKDGAGNSQTVKSINCSSNICPLSVPVDITGTPLATVSNPLFVTGTFFQATQPVSQSGVWTVGISGTIPVSGPLTDTQLRATPLPVSGTFWQAIQPVSLATNTPDVTDRAARLLGHVTVDNASLAVTGTFFQATQPVSIASMPSTPVTGTFFQATQPISAAALPLPSGASTEATLALIKAKTDNLDVLLSTRTKPADTQPVSGPVTDAQLRASPVPVSGTLAAIQSGTWNVGTLTSITNPVTVVLNSQYPSGAAPVTVSATGTTLATTATITAVAAKTNFLCGFSIRANATAAVTGTATVTNTINGTLSFIQWTAPLASNIGVNEQTFNPCIPSSAVNTAMAIASAAPGTGGNVSVVAWGYRL